MGSHTTAPSPWGPWQAGLTRPPHLLPKYLDFAGGQGKAFAACWGPQGDRVELALVEVGHG